MSVHHEISKKVSAVNQIIAEYRHLDYLREKEIEVVLEKARRKEAFSVDRVNQVTIKLNEHATKHHLPTRKIVTQEMIMDAIQP